MILLQFIGVTIQDVDLETQTYIGCVIYLDHVEFARATLLWEAKPSDKHIYEVDKKRYSMQVEATEDVLGAKVFSSRSELNDEIIRQVVRTIAEFNPDLPQAT
ncbi:MAG TPA: hypothetical protein VJG30_03215 [Candidatus Nanoarchaeia archaeon]|nr:hypothetical protein [Candidatus Nanoarchaeia archaeon]